VTHTFDAVILGGGAAGLMAAVEAGKRGRRTALLEHASRAGKKILISGGGRCNFTNRHCGPDNFLSANPHFAKAALARYSSADFIALVEKHRIAYHEKTLGQLFCDHSAQQIVSMFEEECRAAAVQIFTGLEVGEVSRPDRFVVRAGPHEFRAPALVVATGGLSIPKMGATGFAYDLARQFGLRVRECRPALVPLVFTGKDQQRYGTLAGVSTEVVAAVGRQQFREKLLFTHRGLSGPAILQISSYWDGAEPIIIDLAPDRQVAAPLLEAGGSTFRAPLLPAESARRPLARTSSGLRMDQPSPRRLGTTTPSMGSGPRRHRRFRESGSHRRRHRYLRTLGPDDGSSQRARPLFCGRSGGRHRAPRRLQFPMGVGFGILRRASTVEAQT